MASSTLSKILSRSILNPQKGSTLAEEIQCYSLPYGGLGFASHILTYYTVIVLSTGRSPLRPWKQLCNSKFDLWLSTIGLLGGFFVAVFTLVKCRSHWQLLLVGIWKLSMSFFNGAVGVHIAVIMKKAPKPPKKAPPINLNLSSSSYLPLVDKSEGYDVEKRSGTGSIAGSSRQSLSQESAAEQPSTGFVWVWVLLYFPGMIAGFVGLVSLIIENWKGHKTLHTITYVFSAVMGVLVIASLMSLKGDFCSASLFWFVGFASLAALYGDWALGAMVNNLLGMPSGDSCALYWSYFVLKRFTMFST